LNLLKILIPDGQPIINDEYVSLRVKDNILTKNKQFFFDPDEPSRLPPPDKIKYKMRKAPRIRSGYSRCTSCKVKKKTALEFWKKASSPSGYSTICKKCEKEKRNERRKNAGQRQTSGVL